MNNKFVGLILRIAIAGEFIGHGLLAVGGKAQWVDWIQRFGFTDPVVAKQILLLFGCIDMVAAIVMLIKPFPAILLGAAIWAFWTALLRPIVMYLGAPGVDWLDFVERSANWGAPLALLLLIGWPRTIKEWFVSRHE
jgi:hypothetical protein